MNNEDIFGNLGTRRLILTYALDGDGQLRASFDFCPTKEFQYPSCTSLCGFHSRSGCSVEEKPTTPSVKQGSSNPWSSPFVH